MNQPHLFVIAALVIGSANGAQLSSSGPVKDAKSEIQIAIRMCRDEEHRPESMARNAERRKLGSVARTI
jgi:hypothetical protein